jgi:cytochrome c peroxidase
MSIRKTQLLYSCAIALAASARCWGPKTTKTPCLPARSRIQAAADGRRHAGSSLTPERVALGRALFFETRVSNDGKGSCGGCHNPFLYGTDALPRSSASAAKIIPRNCSPTVFKHALQFVQHYWRQPCGRRRDSRQGTGEPVGYWQLD